ncbi:class I SAM-dependent methyltransferase [Vibrio europaeus]|uniref:Methyltransferase domain-containing protein n=1 Tax=Vibrio europaeus TaxID=300876 RepID=A0AAE7DYU0_9VIBR|nr:class I SAM-dependent methyltransferase [Vibrio europaeus]MDC5803363.1 class I SAM-dependent methyltransferase [Vibrio europaeus]MDC5810729.1 class I SAM-dependent methyltransferase [Vibrio europaeus]MDC5823235.1 class I SAM-dependent methyltransferase [Vibrio europaeus]MDC5828926.1 class I SAM-dependent methyltransferase [Vibrio europaeus]MDC5832969.1 class I SAM-dependent methyltransferase [Vibrio europaeus]
MQSEQLPVFFEQLKLQLELAPNEVRRLFHGRGRRFEGLEQLTCDWIQGQLIVSLFKQVSDDFIEELKQGLTTLSESELWQQKQGKVIVVQYRYAEGAPSEVLLGELDNRPVVEESGLKYQLDIGRNQNFGLFLDMRLGRDWVKAHAKHKNVLNLFAYTCGFSVAAIEGGADQVVNVDMSRSSLSKGRENHKLNGHNVNQVKFLGYDIFRSWGKIRKMGRYDLIVIDPPSFQKGSFALTKDYKRILRKLPELLAEGGEVIACVNSPQVTSQFLIDSMQEEAPQLSFVERLDNPQEFEDIDPEASLKVLRFK